MNNFFKGFNNINKIVNKIEKKAFSDHQYNGDKGKEFNEHKNLIDELELDGKEVERTEVNAYLNNRNYPESQINELNLIDQQIEDSKQQIEDINYITDFASDFVNADRTLRTQQRLEREENKKKWMIKGN